MIHTTTNTTTPSHRPQTIKQAKAAYKTRSGPGLSEREQKQISRAAELDRRAVRIRESDKRRADLDRKRLEKEKQDKTQAARLLGSQRRTDRFGYVSSQFHLGAFFGAGVAAGVGAMAGPGPGRMGRDELGCVQEEKTGDQLESGIGNVLEDEMGVNEDGFGDEDLDDDVLLEVLHVDNDDPWSDDEQSIEMIQVLDVAPAQDGATEQDLTALWDDLDSSTQIARDLSSSPMPSGVDTDRGLVSSFGSIDLDISVDEFEAIEKLQDNKTDKLDSHTVRDETKDRKIMPPPPIPFRKPLSDASLAIPTNVRPANPRVASTCGFSMTELESFVDDDLQLTQIEPG